MTARGIVAAIASLVALSAINYVPIELAVDRDLSTVSIMVLYACENCTSIMLTLAFVGAFADRGSEPRAFCEKLKGFAVFSFGFSAATAVFLTIFIVLILRKPVDVFAIGRGLAVIAALQIVEFSGLAFFAGRLTEASADRFLKRSMGRVALLFLAVFGGVFAAAFVDDWFLIPFIVLKGLADFGDFVNHFRSRPV